MFILWKSDAVNSCGMTYKVWNGIMRNGMKIRHSKYYIIKSTKRRTQFHQNVV